MDYYESLKDEILSRYETITSLTQQSKIKGDYTEAVLRDFVARFLPRKYEVGHGIIYSSSKGNTSPECDLIIYNAEIAAPLFKSDDLVVVDGKYVIAVMQVKSQLTSTTLKKAIENLKSVKSVSPSIIGWVVGFETNVLLKTLYLNSWKSHVIQFLQVFRSKCEEDPELMKAQMQFFVKNLRTYVEVFSYPLPPSKNFTLFDYSSSFPSLQFQENETEINVKKALAEIYKKGFWNFLKERETKFQEGQAKKN